MSDEIKWQPVCLILNKRLECECGALAVLVSGNIPDDEEYNVMEDVDVWCQDCFEKSQHEEKEKE
jgi:hypothetical protein